MAFTSGLLLLALLAPNVAGAQLRHMRGQNVAPVIEGWPHNDDTAFGVAAGHRILAQTDEQIQKAFELFPEAADLLATRQALESAQDSRGQVAGY